ncbi:MAG: extracellular solute-binding protein [Acidimicrobiales bacterium]
MNARPPLTILFGTSLLVAACSSGAGLPNDLTGAAATIHSGDCAASVDRTITVYSGRSVDLIGPAIDAFECESGIEVRTNFGDPTDLALLLSDEGDRTEADVFLSKSPGAVGFLRNDGLLRGLSDEVLDLVSDQNRASDGSWVGVTGRQRVLVYNIDQVTPEELPDSIFELTDDRFRGQVGIPANNGSFLDWFTLFRAEHGDDVALKWLRDMVANDSVVTESNRPTVDAVGRGELRYGLVNHYYNFQEAEALGPDHRAENHVFPSEDVGSLVIVTAAGVTTSSDHVDEAERFLSFLLSSGAQSFFTNDTLEYPLAADVTPAAILPDLEQSESFFDTTFDDLGDGLTRTIALIEESGINR